MYLFILKCRQVRQKRLNMCTQHKCSINRWECHIFELYTIKDNKCKTGKKLILKSSTAKVNIYVSELIYMNLK